MNDTQHERTEACRLLSDLTDKLYGEESEIWIGGLRKFLQKENPWEQVQPSIPSVVSNHAAKTYPTPFDPKLTWTQRILRGKFDRVSAEIWINIDRFIDIEIEDSSPLDIELDYFEKSMLVAEVELFQAQKQRKMISPARFLHLCETHPTIQQTHPIVCTKKICMGRRNSARVLCARGNDSKRVLCFSDQLDYFSSRWGFPSVPENK